MLFIGSGLYFLYSWSLGDRIGLPYQVATTYESVPFLLNYFDIDGLPSGIYVDQLIAWQNYFTEDIHYNPGLHQLLFWAFLICMVLVTVFISLLDRYNYLIAAGAICLMLTQLHFEELGLWQNSISYIIIGLFICTSYYFQAFRPQSPWTLRLIVSLVVYSILIGLFAYLSPVIEQPLVAISQGILGPIILSLLFVLFVAGENIFSLFKLATTAQPGKKGLIHFALIGGIYLIICYLLFKEKNEGLSFDLYFIGPELLMISSMLSAYFSFDLRNHELDQATSRLLKTYLFPAIGILFLLTYSFSIVTVNDSLQNCLEWIIIIAHFTLGATYFVYALINFAPALLQDFSIWKAFYRGPRTAILTVRMMGFILFLGGFFYLSYEPYYLAKAGQFNMLGDLARYLNKKDVARSYYKQSIYNDYFNLKANYSIHQLAEKEYDQAEAKTNLQSVFKHHDSPVTRIALANTYAKENRLFKSLETLQKSTPGEQNDELSNNLGLAHYYYKNYDSAYHYFLKGQSEVNLEGIKYLLNDRLPFQLEKTSPNIDKRINQQALANLNKENLKFEFNLAPDTLITRADIFYLYNASLSRAPMDREALIKTLTIYIDQPKNELFASFLYTARALAYYHEGWVNQAFQDIDLVISRSPNTAGFETYLKGIWYFDQGQTEQTVAYINKAQQRGFQNEQIKKFVAAVKNIKNYTEEADLSDLWQETLHEYENLGDPSALLKFASMNAFDVENTLNAIYTLKQANYDPKTIYDLLLSATDINHLSPQLLEAYIYQAQELNLTSFADTALEEYSNLASYDEFFRVAKQLNDMREGLGIN
jgi:hypothetical protein